MQLILNPEEFQPLIERVVAEAIRKLEAKLKPQVTPKGSLLMDASSAAKALSICSKTLWLHTKAKKIPCVRIGGRVLYSSDDLRAWIERNKSE